MNINVTGEKKKWVVELLQYLLSPENELETAKALRTMPTQNVLYQNDFVMNDEIMRNSQTQIDRGKLMPVVPEMRAIWDSMRPSYQAVLNGVKTPAQAAGDMQREALQRIKEMNE